MRKNFFCDQFLNVSKPFYKRNLLNNMMKKHLLCIVVLFFTFSYISAQKKITGIINDSSGSPAPGVTILVKGTTIGTQTDFDGKFAIIVPDDNAILVISFVGFSNMEVVVGNQSTLEINLVEIVNGLEKDVIEEPEKKYATVRVMFATDRKYSNSTKPQEMFGTTRSKNVVTYGTCDVSMPRNHKLGELEKASVLNFEFYDDPEKHVLLLGASIKSKEDFFNILKARINSSKKKSAFIFIHGYNVSFEDAARRTAQMSYDLGFEGVPVFYSWPSVGETISYIADAGNIEWSQGYLKIFLEDFLKTSGAQDIYLIAHSMGNRGLTRALSSIIAENPSATTKIKEIILAAPDIDGDVFKKDIAPVLVKIKKPITLYASSNDLALRASQMFSAYPRAGQAGSSMVVLSGIETIDASNVPSDLLGHSYFSGTPDVLSDIFQIIHEGTRPDKRTKLRAVVKNGQTSWEFLK